MLLFLSLIAVLVPPDIQGKLTDELKAQINKASPDEMVSCIVIMKETYPYEAMEAYPIKERIRAYRQIAEMSQRPLIDWLSGRSDAIVHQRFWVLNGIYLEAKPEIILEIARRPDVGWISHNGEVHIIAEPGYAPGISSRGIPWNIRKIMADSCWAAGYTGQGVILGEVDSGVDYTHPALQGKWSGYWHVASGLPPSSTPYDDNGHGTHCMGTIMGGDGPGPFSEDIGIAFNAKFVAAKAISSNGTATYSQALECLQFMANLKDSVDVKAVSNSWGSPYVNDTFFYPITRTYLSIGIVPVFANGNNGSLGTVIPGNYSTTIGVGATDSTDTIASFSSRGPAPNLPPWNDPSTWLRSDWNLTKPQISAPGVAVYSSIPGGGYAYKNGTSMATPHVTGAIGLICQKNPALNPKIIYDILVKSVDNPSNGFPYSNNNYGWGRLNVWRAVRGTPTSNGPYISIYKKQITDPPPGGNGNGLIEPGETGQMTISIKNLSSQTGTNTTVILQSFDNFVSVINGFYNFGVLLPRDSASNSSNPYTFRVHNLTPPGHIAKIGVIIHSDGPHDTLDFDDTVFYSLRIGNPPPPYAIFADDFEYGGGIDSLRDYWIVGRHWARSDSESHSLPYSLHYWVTYRDSDTVQLRYPLDLRDFPDARISFWYAYYKVPPNWARFFLEGSSDGGVTWDTIWWSWNDGGSIDTMPWTEKIFPLTGYISNNFTVRFRTEKIGTNQTFAKWFIDDFKIFIPADNEPPYFTNTTRWTDTSFTGPFPVRSTITDASGVDSVYLYYRINNGAWQKLVMTHQGNNIYQATIPSQALYTTVHYYLWARDKWVTPNSGCDPVGAPQDGYYGFYIRPVGMIEQKGEARVITFSVSPNPFRKNLIIRYTIQDTGEMIQDTRYKIQDIRLKIYDVSGRIVKSFNLESCIMYHESVISWDGTDDSGRKLPSGVYFVRLESDNFKKTEKVILLR